MSRTDARSRSLRRRPSRLVPATIVAVVLLALGALTAIAAITRLAGGAWPSQVTGVTGPIAGATWGSAAVITGGAVAVVLGIVLLVAGVTPGSYRTAELASPGSSEVAETDFVISTAALARLAAAQADTVDGVDRVAASATGRQVRLSITTTSEQTDQIRERVQRGVVERLAAAGVSPAPRVITTVRTKGI